MTYQALTVSDGIPQAPPQEYISFTDEEETRRYDEMMGRGTQREDEFDDFDAQGLSDLRG